MFTESCQRIDTKEECEKLARAFGLPDRIATTSENQDTPPKCYYQSKFNRLWFNTAVADNNSPCTDTRICVCKDGLQPALKLNATTEELEGQELVSNYSVLLFHELFNLAYYSSLCH